VIGKIRRYWREEKRKALSTKSRKPKGWVPHEVLPNLTLGILTRVRRIEILEKERQAKNDRIIHDVLVVVQEDDLELSIDIVAQEFQHTIGNMDTCNIDLWDAIFLDNTWRIVKPISKVSGFLDTYLGDALIKVPQIQEKKMLEHLKSIYEN